MTSKLSSSLFCPEKCRASGEGIRVAMLGNTSTLSVVVVDQGGEPCDIPEGSCLSCELVARDGYSTSGNVMKREYSSFDISYQPLRRGRHLLHISIAGIPIMDSPFLVNVLPNFAVPKSIVEGVSSPCSLAVWRGEMTAVEGSGNKLSIITALGERREINGNPPPQSPGLFYSRAMDTQGNHLVCYYGQHCIRVYLSSGEHCQTVGTYGSDPLQFKHPAGIVVHSTTRRVYVVDSRNHRIQILNPDLTHWTSFGGRGSSVGEFNDPFDIATTSSTDCCSLQGACISQVVRSLHYVEEVQELPLPTVVRERVMERMVSDNIYVTDRVNRRVQVFSPGGEYIRSFGRGEHGEEILTEPAGIAVDGYGVVYVCDSGSHRISLFTTAGEYIKTVGREGTKPAQFSRPLRVAVDGNGTVYVCDVGNERVQIFE